MRLIFGLLAVAAVAMGIVYDILAGVVAGVIVGVTFVVARRMERATAAEEAAELF